MTARTGARWAGYVAFAVAFAIASIVWSERSKRSDGTGNNVAKEDRDRSCL